MSAISHPDGEGYAVLQSDGLIRTFGDAQVPVGYSPSPPVMVPAVGIATTPHGTGNWVVDADGHVLAFGGAVLQGSAGGIARPGSVVSVAASMRARYWLASSDGGIFSYGTAQFAGSLGARHLNQPIVNIVSVP